MVTDVILLIAMMVAAIWAVVGRSLLKASISLAITSAILTVIMFRLDSPLAAVFELSVCSGLITVIFVSTISLTKPLTGKEIMTISRARIKRFWYLPVIVVIAGIIFFLFKIPLDFNLLVEKAAGDVRSILWNSRQMDLIGQLIAILAGAIGVVILFEERKKDEW